MNDSVGAEPDSRLRRDIGFTGSAFLSFNGIVGAGIFALPATLHVQFGAFSPWLFPIFGLLILLVALPFARLAALFPQSGGPVAYTAAFGPLASFQAGWLYYLARVTALAANANVFATYAASMPSSASKIRSSPPAKRPTPAAPFRALSSRRSWARPCSISSSSSLMSR